MKIAYLYYDFLNLYGEVGNIKIITNVLKENKIKYEVLYLSLNDKLEFDKYDFVYIGSGTEKNQKIALEHLLQYQADLKKYIENDKFILATGNSLDLFGKTIIADKEYPALNILDYTIKQDKRIISEVYLNSNVSNKIIGFKNTNSYIDKIEYPLFESDSFKYHNLYATYVLGPILVRNPDFFKYFITKLIAKKLKLDLKLETKAYKTFIANFKQE